MAAAKMKADMLREAGERAERNPNACITCVMNIWENLQAPNPIFIDLCLHFRDADRGLQSRDALIRNAVVEAEDAQEVLRCTDCYQAGRDCFQVPKVAVPSLVEVMKKLHALAGPVMKNSPINLNDVPSDKIEEIRTDLKRVIQTIVTVATKYAGNPLTPLHSGSKEFKDTQILGRTDKEKRARKARTGEAEDELATPKKSKLGFGGGMSVGKGAEGRLQQQIDYLAQKVAAGGKGSKKWKEGFEVLRGDGFSWFP